MLNAPYLGREKVRCLVEHESDFQNLLDVAVVNGKAIPSGCRAAACATCVVKIGDGNFSQMTDAESDCLKTLGFPIDGTIRLACQTQVRGNFYVELAE